MGCIVTIHANVKYIRRRVVMAGFFKIYSFCACRQHLPFLPSVCRCFFVVLQWGNRRQTVLLLEDTPLSSSSPFYILPRMFRASTAERKKASQLLVCPGIRIGGTQILLLSRAGHKLFWIWREGNIQKINKKITQAGMQKSQRKNESERRRGKERDATYNCTLMKYKQYSLRECVWAGPPGWPKGSALLVS